MRTLQSLVASLLTRVKLLATRGTVRASDDSTRAVELELGALKGESLHKVERMAHFGLSSRPPAGAEVVILSLGGDRRAAIVIAEEDRASRPVGELEEGDTMLWAKGPARVILRADGSIEIEAPGGVGIGGDVLVDGNVSATGDVADLAGTLAALRNAYNVHTHPDPQGGSTGPPVPTV